jgi:DNA polymerase-3 subunit gamma/tau
LRSIAEISEGGMRDALSRLDQLVSFAGDKPTLEHAEKVFGLVSRPKLLSLLESLAAGDARAGLVFAEEAFDGGKDVAEVLGSLINLSRLLMLLTAAAGDAKGLDLPESDIPRMKTVAAKFGLQGLVYVAEILSDCRQRVRRAAFPRVMVEAAFIKLTMIGKLEPLSALLERLDGVADSVERPVAQAKGTMSQDEAPAKAEAAVTPPAAKVAAVKAAPEAPSEPAGGQKGPSEADRRAVDAVRKHFGAK